MAAPDDDLDFGQTIRGFAEGQKVFGRYTLRKVLGRGGMGIVWLAWDEKLEEEIALKFMPEMVRLDDAGIQDLKRETRKSLKLTHANIVRIRDFVEDANSAAIAMEYVDGPTLSSLRIQQPGGVFAPEQLMPWLRQFVGALTYAHETEGVVHRDLKPANLMVNSRGQLKVADFGISGSVTDSVSRMSMKVGSSGSPPYMSPQQVMGDPPQATDDIYSVGATIYELLTGKPPFHSGNIYAQIRDKVPSSMSRKRAELGVTGGGEIPVLWDKVVARCLAKNPEERPQSARQVLDWLEGREGREEVVAVSDELNPGQEVHVVESSDDKISEVFESQSESPIIVKSGKGFLKAAGGWITRNVLVASLIITAIASATLSGAFWFAWKSHTEFMSVDFATSPFRYVEPYEIVAKLFESEPISGPDGKDDTMEITPQPAQLWERWRAQAYSKLAGVPNPYSVAPFPSTPEQVEKRRSALQAMEDYDSATNFKSLSASVDFKVFLTDFAIYFALFFPVALLVIALRSGWRPSKKAVTIP